MKKYLLLIVLPFLLSSCNGPVEIKDTIVDFSYLESERKYDK